MAVRVRQVDGGYRIDGDWDGLDPANAFLAHLSGRGFSPASVRAYGFDGVNLARFLSERMAYMHMRGLDTRVGMWSSGRFPQRQLLWHHWKAACWGGLFRSR